MQRVKTEMRKGLSLAAQRYDLMILTPILLFFSVSFAITYPLFYVNQNNYFPSGMRMAGVPYLQNDWFSNILMPSALFTMFVRIIASLHIMQLAVDVVEISLCLCFLLSIYLLIGILVREIRGNADTGPKQRSNRTVSLALFCLLLIGFSGVAEDFLARVGAPQIVRYAVGAVLHDFGGLANQSVWERYLQPSEFGVLVLLALVFLYYQRWQIASVLMAVASMIEFSYMIHCAAILSICGLWMWFHGKRVQAFRMILLFAVFLIPFVFFAMLFVLAQPDLAAADAIYARYVIPFHANPAVWIQLSDILYSAIMLVACVIAIHRLRGPLKWIVICGIVYTIMSVVALLVVHSDNLELLFPWRGSIFFVPLSILIVVVTAADYVLRLTARFGRYLYPAFTAAVVIVFFVSIPVQVADDVTSLQARNAPLDELSQGIRQFTGVHDVILFSTNSGWSDFRLRVQRPIYVDVKGQGVLPSDLMEYWRRLQFVKDFYKASDQQQQQLCHQESIAYYLLPTMETQQKPVFSTSQYQLMKC